MSCYSLLLAATGILCPGGPLLAPKPAVQPLQVIETDCGVSAGIGLSPDGKRVFCFNGSTVGQIDLADGKEGKKLPLPQKLRGEKIYTGVHVQDDVWLLAISRPKYLTDADGYRTRFVLFDFATETIKADWAAHKDFATALAVAPKQNWLITAGTFLDDKTVCFWDRKTLNKVAEMDLLRELRLQETEKSRKYVSKMAIDPSSTFLVFGLEDGAVQVWDLDKKTWHPVLQKSDDSGLEFLRFIDSRTLAVGWRAMELKGWGLKRVVVRNFVEVYDWKAGKVLFRVDHNSNLTDIAPSPDGRIMAFGDWSWERDDTWIRLWDVAAKREVAAFKAHEDHIKKMIFTHEVKRLVTSGRDGKIKVWDVERIVKSSQP